MVRFTRQVTFAAGGITEKDPTCLAEQFPTEVRASAGGSCYHHGAFFGDTARSGSVSGLCHSCGGSQPEPLDDLIGPASRGNEQFR